MKTPKLLIVALLLFCVSTSVHFSYASSIEPDTAGAKGIAPSYYPKIQPTSGPQKTLAILVEFSDVKHAVNETTINDMIFGQMAEYYLNVSYGQIQVVGRSVGWYQLHNPMAFYGADTNPSQQGSDTNPVQLIRDAITAAEPDVDFNAYSKIIVVHAGAGQEDSSSVSNEIWSEAYWYDLGIQANNGAVVNAAAIAPEMETRGHSPLGVYTHEYGHLLGLLDLYDYNAASGAPEPFVGRWSLMATGLWLGNPAGSSPAELEAWSRTKSGWLSPDGIQLSPSNLSLQLEELRPLETSNGTRAVKITTNSSTNYYMIEFREQIGFDQYLPSSGIIITRIDETQDSGGEIVQVIDANPATKTLNDAPYQVGDTFEDAARHVFVSIISRTADTVTVLVANQKTSDLVLHNTQVTGPQIVNATYSQPSGIYAIMADQAGNKLSGLPVKLQYYHDEQWFDLASNLTDGQGAAHFDVPLQLKPGNYDLRFLFGGGKFGNLFLVGSDQLARLNLAKVQTQMQFSGASQMQAGETSTMRINVTDEFGNFVRDLQASVWLDGKLTSSQRLVNGTIDLTLNFGFYQVGGHNLTISVGGNPYYEGSTAFENLTVVAPIWLHVPIAVTIIVVGAILYLIKRPRGKRRRRR
jgi:M6 family metalloprotease-like protein